MKKSFKAEEELLEEYSNVLLNDRVDIDEAYNVLDYRNIPVNRIYLTFKEAQEFFLRIKKEDERLGLYIHPYKIQKCSEYLSS